MNRYKGSYLGGEERPFNMAELLLNRLDRRLDEANIASIDGQLLRWFRVLRTLKSSIMFKVEFDPEKVKVIVKEEVSKEKFVEKEIELSMQDYLKKEYNSLQSKLKNAKLNIGKSDAIAYDVEEALSGFEELLIKLMYKYGIYYPKYEPKPWQEKAEEEDI